MQLRMLGPFEVLADGLPQRPPGPGERSLLAVLAVSAGTVVAASTLIDALWSEDGLPSDPANALQIRVLRLRRYLGALGDPDLVSRRGSGYRLDLDPDAVDVHAFTRRVESARRTGDPVQAAEAYRLALDMSQGEPLVDFAVEAWAVVERARLTELRLAAVAEQADRLLTLGWYEQAVTALEPVVTAAPTRERLVGQLMTALFNAGRQAEAVDLFGRTRTALSEELGLDPSRELRTVMEQILRQDPEISGSARPTTSLPSQRERGVTVGTGGNLPLRTTSFVGRDSELERTRELLGTTRLVTLAGPGGAGKTALAVEAARTAASTFPDGAWLVRLAAVTERQLLPHAIADALALSIEGGTAARRARDVLVGHLARREILIVLDNCEHLLEPVAQLVETVLARCPAVRILATSREALAVPGEVQQPVAPLAVPGSDTPASELPGVPAVRLFLDRAEAGRPDLHPDGGDLDAVAMICRHLDGIPLALELAAARLGSLTLAELAARVQDRFAVLTTGSRTAETRQRTLRSTVDWSHDLLTGDEQRLFRRLAVFRGGWTLPAAEAVTAADDLPVGSVLDLLDRLVRQSLVVADPTGDHTRYRMLETLRQYAAERLGAAGEDGSAGAAHAAYVLDLAERAETGLRGRTQPTWTAALRDENANVRAALGWLTAAGRADDALCLAGSLGMWWHMGRHLEGRTALRTVLALPGGSPPARARALQALSLVERPRACIVHPNEQCAAAARESLAVFETGGDRPRAALSRVLLAVEGVATSPTVDADQLLAEADRDFADLGDAWGRAVVAFVRAEIQLKRGDEPSARAAADHATDLFRAVDDGWGLSAVLYHYGYGLHRLGAHDDAVPLLEEAIEVAARAGVSNTVQWATADLGLALLALGRVEDAAVRFDQAGAVSEQVGDHAGRVLATYADALVAKRDGDLAAARTMFAEAQGAFERLGVRQAAAMSQAGAAGCDEASGDLVAAAEGYQRLLQLADEAGDVALVALALEGLGRAVVDTDPERTAELLGRAADLRDRHERPPGSADRKVTERAARRARKALGAGAYDEAARRGAQEGGRPVPA